MSYFITLGAAANFAKLFGQSKKFGAEEEKNWSLSNFHFSKEFGLKKNSVFVRVSGKIIIFLRLP